MKFYRIFELAEKDLFNYIGVFYNRGRIHGALDHVSPVVLEELYEISKKKVV